MDWYFYQNPNVVSYPPMIKWKDFVHHQMVIGRDDHCPIPIDQYKLYDNRCVQDVIQMAIYLEYIWFRLLKRMAVMKMMMDDEDHIIEEAYIFEIDIDPKFFGCYL